LATYYWVGGTGAWDDITHWSATSGGSGGAGVPTSVDDVILDSSSGSGTWQMGNAAFSCRNLTVSSSTSLTSFQQAGLNPNTANIINLYGNFTANKTFFFNNGSNMAVRIVASKFGSQTINASGVGTNNYLALTVKSGSTTTITSAFAFGAGPERTFTIESGGSVVLQIDIYSCKDFTCQSGASLTFGGGGAYDFYFDNSFTVDSGATVSVPNGGWEIYANAPGIANLTFSGGGKTYPPLFFQNSNAGFYSITDYSQLTILDTNTFFLVQVRLSNYINMRVILAANIIATIYVGFVNTNTPYLYNFRTYLQSSVNGVARSITSPTKTTNKYLIVQDMTVTGSTNDPMLAFASDNCVNNGNNTNWNFGASGFPIILD